MKTYKEDIKDRYEATFSGYKAAKNGHKLDANPYPETDDLHFVWLASYTDKRLLMLSRKLSQ